MLYKYFNVASDYSTVQLYSCTVAYMYPDPGDPGTADQTPCRTVARVDALRKR